MAWTAPSGHVFTVGEVLTAATMNTYVANNLSFLYGDTAWTAPSYTNSWVDTGAPYFTVGYRLYGIWVELRGTMKSGTMSVAAFTLPAGYRPSATAQFATPSSGVYGQTTVGVVGNVIPVSGTNAGIALDGVHFATI